MDNRPDLPAHDVDQAEGIRMTEVYRAILRVLVHLEKKEYTSVKSNKRQADVVEHDDPPDLASAQDISQG